MYSKQFYLRSDKEVVDPTMFESHSILTSRKKSCYDPYILLSLPLSLAQYMVVPCRRMFYFSNALNQISQPFYIAKTMPAFMVKNYSIKVVIF